MSGLPKNPVVAVFEAAIKQTESEVAEAEKKAHLHRSFGKEQQARDFDAISEGLKQKLREEQLLLKGAKCQAESASIHTSYQMSENAKGERPPKVLGTDVEMARAKAKELWPEILASTPDGHGQISRALGKVMNKEFALGKRIGDYVDKEPLRQTLTRKKLCKSGAST